MTDDALVRRYGPAGAGLTATRNATIELLLSHRSVRAYTGEDVAEADLTAILAAASSAATSSNLQSWSVVVVRDPELRQRLAAVANDAAPLAAAPLGLIWVADLARDRAIAEGIDTEWADHFDATLVAIVDAALAAQNAVVAAESLGLGTCYLGSIRDAPETVSELLGLPFGAVAVFGLAIGHPDPSETSGVKPRLPLSVVAPRERYAPASEADLAGYDEAYHEYFQGQGASRTWRERIRSRFHRGASVRIDLRQVFAKLGLPSD